MDPEKDPAEGLSLLGREVEATDAAHVEVTLRQAVRGGITITARAEVGSPERG